MYEQVTSRTVEHNALSLPCCKIYRTRSFANVTISMNIIVQCIFSHAPLLTLLLYAFCVCVWKLWLCISSLTFFLEFSVALVNSNSSRFLDSFEEIRVSSVSSDQFSWFSWFIYFFYYYVWIRRLSLYDRMWHVLMFLVMFNLWTFASLNCLSRLNCIPKR